MAVHLAIVRSAYLDALLRGHKTIEARLSRLRCDPFGRIRAGERIYFKRVSGPVRATALAHRVEMFANLRPIDVLRLRGVYNDRIRADAAFWAGRATARYATLVFLCGVEPVDFGPDAPARPAGSRRAWIVLPDEADVYPACLRPDGLFTSG